MRRLMGFAAVMVLGLSSAPPALATCTCRAKDVVATEGQTLCIVTPDGRRLARCDKVLNNSSWTFLREGCPLVSARR